MISCIYLCKNNTYIFPLFKRFYHLLRAHNFSLRGIIVDNYQLEVQVHASFYGVKSFFFCSPLAVIDSIFPLISCLIRYQWVSPLKKLTQQNLLQSCFHHKQHKIGILILLDQIYYYCAS